MPGFMYFWSFGAEGVGVGLGLGVWGLGFGVWGLGFRGGVAGFIRIQGRLELRGCARFRGWGLYGQKGLGLTSL